MRSPGCSARSASVQPWASSAAEGVAHFGRGTARRRPSARACRRRVGRHDVVVAGEHDRRAGREQLRGMRDQPLEPAQLVIELRPGRGIAVGQIEAADQQPVDRGLDIAAVQSSSDRRAGRAASRSAPRRGRGWRRRSSSSGRARSRHSPPRAIGAVGKFLVRRLQLLQADDIGLGLGEPAQQHRQAAIDAVDVEGRDLHCARRPGARPFLYRRTGPRGSAICRRGPLRRGAASGASGRGRVRFVLSLLRDGPGLVDGNRPKKKSRNSVAENQKPRYACSMNTSALSRLQNRGSRGLRGDAVEGKGGRKKFLSENRV